MGRTVVERIRGEVDGPSREETQRAFDRIVAQIDEMAATVEATGEKIAEAVFPVRDVALVVLECSLQLEAIRELGAENELATRLMAEAAELIIAKKETENSLMYTIFQTWCYLGRYKNDADDATHAKRLLQNCLLVRGSDKVKDAVRKKMLAPPPEKWWKRAWVDYAYFGAALWAAQFALVRGNLGWAVASFFFAVWGAVDVASRAAKGGAHVQAV